MNNLKNIDKYIIVVLSIIFVLALAIFDAPTLGFALVLTLFLLLYEIIIYDQRHIYGFTALRYASIPALITLSFTIFIAIPSVYICTIETNPAKYNYFVAILLFYVLYPMGLKLGNFLYPVDGEKIKLLPHSKFIKSKIDHFYYELLLLLLSVIILIFTIYLIRVEKIPLIALIQDPGDYGRLIRLREESLKLLDVTFIEGYLIQWMRALFVPIGVIGSLFLATEYKKRNYIFLFIVFFVLGMIINTITLEKSPSASILLSIIAFFFLRLKKITLGFILISFVIMFLTPVLIMTFTYLKHPNLGKLLYISLLDRIFVKPSEVLFLYYKIFPDFHDFLYGRSTQLFSWLHPEGTFPISNFVAKIWWGHPQTTGFANTNYLGNYWADFGWYGVVLSTIFFGFIMHLVFRRILIFTKYSKNIAFATIITSLVPIFTFHFFSNNFTILFFTRGLILLIVVMIMIESFDRFELRKIRFKQTLSYE